jgi:hypothetical protein
MPTEYVHIDASHHQPENGSQIRVDLPAPLLHATSVSCVSFSAPNDFFNVREPYNVFRLLIYKAVADSNAYAQFDYVVPPGLYAIGELVEKLNTLMAANKPQAAGSTSQVTVSLSVLASGKVTIQTAGTTNPAKAILIYVPVGEFMQSLANRLGFSYYQVTQSDLPEQVRDSGSGLEWTEDYQTWTLLTDKSPRMYKIFNVTDQPATNTATSDSVGFEAIGSRVLLRSSLVRDAYRTVAGREPLGVERSNVLQEIPIDVGPLSYIHHRGYNKQALQHSLDGRPITSFWVELCDESGNAFQPGDYKHYSLTLQFDTEVDQAAEAAHREQTLLAMDQQFRSRHRC